MNLRMSVLVDLDFRFTEFSDVRSPDPARSLRRGSGDRAGQRPRHRVPPVHDLPSRDVLLVVLCTRLWQPVVGEEGFHVALEAVMRDRVQAFRLVKAADTQVDLPRSRILERERRAALPAEAATCDLRRAEVGGLPDLPHEGVLKRKEEGAEEVAESLLAHAAVAVVGLVVLDERRIADRAALAAASHFELGVVRSSL